MCRGEQEHGMDRHPCRLRLPPQLSTSNVSPSPGPLKTHTCPSLKTTANPRPHKHGAHHDFRNGWPRNARPDAADDPNGRGANSTGYPPKTNCHRSKYTHPPAWVAEFPLAEQAAPNQHKPRRGPLQPPGRSARRYARRYAHRIRLPAGRNRKQLTPISISCAFSQ